MSNSNAEIKSVFYQSLEQPREKRTEFLDQACGPDSTLRREVEALLKVHDDLGTFMEDPLSLLANDAAIKNNQGNDDPTLDLLHQGDTESAEPDPSLFPGYEMIRILGRGGMGVVFLARQLNPNRMVALKVLNSLAFEDDQRQMRFHRETEAIARLQHPNIVQIFEVAEHDGQSYFSLEYCSAGSLDKYLAGQPLKPGEAAELTQTLARAIAVAHDAQIVHRDLKPANVLLSPNTDAVSRAPASQSESDAKPSLSLCTLKLTDFGLAKQLDEVSQTTTGQILGTPSYMAPEQAEPGQEVGYPADIYALGSILYECLTGRPPFRAATSLETILQVTQQPPVPPRQLQPGVPRDLDTICLKCLHKEPSRRYASAQELAEDLHRFLLGKPILARPVGPMVKAWLWARRNPVIATLLVTIFVVLSVGIVSTSLALLQSQRNLNAANAQTRIANIAKGNANREKDRANREKDRANREKTNALKNLDEKLNVVFASQVRNWQPVFHEDPTKAVDLLHDYRLCPIHLRTVAWHLCNNLSSSTIKKQSLSAHKFFNGKLAFSPDGKILATFGIDAEGPNSVKLWDVETGNRIATIPFGRNSCAALVFSPDAKTLVTANADKAKLECWDTATGKQHGPTMAGRFFDLMFDPTGTSLLAAEIEPRSFAISRWDINTRKRLSRFQQMRTLPGVGAKTSAFSPDGRFFVLLSRKPTAKKKSVFVLDLWDTSKEEKVTTLETNEPTVQNFVLSADGKLLAFASQKRILVWDVETHKQIAEIDVEGTSTLCFDPANGNLTVALMNRSVQTWAIPSAKLVKAFTTPTRQKVDLLTYSPDGKSLAFSNFLGNIHVWRKTSSQETVSCPDTFLACYPEQDLIVTHDKKNHRYAFRMLPDLQVKHSITERENFRKVIILPGGNEFISSIPDQIQVRSTKTGMVKRLIGKANKNPANLVLSRNGQYLAGQTDQSSRITIWEVATGKELASLNTKLSTNHEMAFSPDCHTIAFGNSRRGVSVWNVPGNKPVTELTNPRGQATALLFHPNGDVLLVGMERNIILWDTKTWNRVATLKEHQRPVTRLAISPDGNTLASADSNGMVVIWDLRAEMLQTEFAMPQEVTALAFGNMSHTLAAVLGNGEIHQWNLQPSKTVAMFKPEGHEVISVAFSSDSSVLKALVNIEDEFGKTSYWAYWDLRTGMRLSGSGEKTFVENATVSPNGELEAIIEGTVIKVRRRSGPEKS